MVIPRWLFLAGDSFWDNLRHCYPPISVKTKQVVLVCKKASFILLEGILTKVKQLVLLLR